MRRFAAALILVLVAAPGRGQEAPAAPPEPELVGGEWLVLPAVDTRGRQPFNPDAVFVRYLLERPFAAPSEGQTVRGTNGERETWTKVSVDEQGRVPWTVKHRRNHVAWAYRTYDSDHERVVLADCNRGASLFVNGTGYVGDIYSLNTGPVPVLLRKGANHIFVRGSRGGSKLTFKDVDPAMPIVLSAMDMTLPDLVVGEAYVGEAAITITNASADSWIDWLDQAPPGDATFIDPPSIAPLAVLKLPLRISAPAISPEPDAAGAHTILVHFPAKDPFSSGPPLNVGTILPLRVREPEQVRKITFRSAQDDSVQYYAVRPPTGDAAGVVLSLHGAGVKAPAQARSYGPKEDLWICAPTNRRPYGFDWQDWGRRDAYEALEHVLAATGVDPAEVYLTGHSMGGHGTWHLAANDPDRFRAIGPSAAWSQFDNVWAGRPNAARDEPWLGADRASDTMSLIDNLAQIPTFILHGEKDDNVPLSEAERMLAALRAAGAAPLHHFEPDKKHWWDGYPEPGTACVDWPAMFELFSAPEQASPQSGRMSFTSVDPGVDSTHGFVTVEQVLEYGQSFHVSSERMGNAIHVDTQNVAHLQVTSPLPGEEIVWVLNGTTAHMGAERSLWFHTDGEKWTLADGAPPAGEKSSVLSGPFKRAFDRRFVMVIGTAGDETENDTLLARARYDAQVWKYRGNGRGEIVTDENFKKGDYAGRNVVLYGNVSTNTAWTTVIGGDTPIAAERGKLTVGEKTYEGDAYAALFVRPRKDDPAAIVGVFADTGVAGSRLGYNVLTFVSGVGYPDYTVFSPTVLHAGTDGVLEAGWFDVKWKIQQE